MTPPTELHPDMDVRGVDQVWTKGVSSPQNESRPELRICALTCTSSNERATGLEPATLTLARSFQDEALSGVLTVSAVDIAYSFVTERHRDPPIFMLVVDQMWASPGMRSPPTLFGRESWTSVFPIGGVPGSRSRIDFPIWALLRLLGGEH